ncbi:hypothetical protein LSM04_001178 [Trypanosoma melophagium]|uniref:uncharacterized protein n=1 Tax=Trypanosoma melophagium TaxID=715481 RepID=UPI00351A0825|nr:hypothetical protein LSM04_001178 [Trypanosoma melophagium]
MQRLIRSRRSWKLMDIRRRPPTLNRLQGVLQFTQHPTSVADHRRGHHFDASAQTALYSRPGRVGNLHNPDATWHLKDVKKLKKKGSFNAAAFRRNFSDS